MTQCMRGHNCAAWPTRFAARLSILGFPSPPLSFHRMRVLVPCLCFMLLLASVEASDMFRSAYFAVSWRRRAA